MKRFRTSQMCAIIPVKRWYGKYPRDAYALGPIEATSKTEARQIFKRMFGAYPREVWLA